MKSPWLIFGVAGGLVCASCTPDAHQGEQETKEGGDTTSAVNGSSASGTTSMAPDVLSVADATSKPEATTSSGSGVSPGMEVEDAGALSEVQVGSVTVARRFNSEGTATVAATFVYRDPAWLSFREDNNLACTETTYGDCTLRTCPALPATLATPSAAREDAGTIAVTTTDGFLASGVPDDSGGIDGLGYAFSSSGELGGGELLTFVASGGSVEEFSGSVELPLAGYLTSHLVGSGTTGIVDIEVPRTQDLVLAWDTRDSAERVQAIASSEAGSETRRLTCAVNAATGGLTIDHALLLQLEPGTTFVLLSTNWADVATSRGTVRLGAAFEMWGPERAGLPRLMLQ
jgi:hypothetical protein